ncbi:MAG: hypothetical protein PHW82_15130 [Bacteroidales bacterium]|nr:hypothetical protein [Bacteroidales bacterium]
MYSVIGEICGNSLRLLIARDFEVRTMEQLNPPVGGNNGTIEQWNNRTIEQWNNGTMEHLNNGASE